MRKVKLTLSVDKTFLEKAKSLALSRKTSVSQLFEDLLMPELQIQHNTAGTASSALKLRGIAKGKLSEKSDRQIRDMMLKDRYNL